MTNCASLLLQLIEDIPNHLPSPTESPCPVPARSFRIIVEAVVYAVLPGERLRDEFHEATERGPRLELPAFHGPMRSNHEASSETIEDRLRAIGEADNWSFSELCFHPAESFR